MITQNIQSDLIKAMKSKDQSRLETLRYILAQIKNKEIDKKTALSDEEVVALLRKQVKEIEESIVAFKKGSREDLVQSESAKKDIVASYLPAEISDDELLKEIRKIIDANLDLYQKSPKNIIGICMKELRQKADPSRIMKALQNI